jgi:ring-1,2-phenylacetyl-CoA epoxidase subunit PaaE
MLTYHPLTLVHRETIAEDAVSLEFTVPDEWRGQYAFVGGQHLPVRAVVDGQELRRTYSLLQGTEGRLMLGVRVQGVMSLFLAALPIGSTVEAMPPSGRFRAAVDAAQPRRHVAFAAGSGITPILSILMTVLEQEPEAHFTLYYGNRSLSRTMFVDALFALKNRYMARLTLHFLMSREQQDIARQYGRLEPSHLEPLLAADLESASVDEWYVCGPDAMVGDLTGMLARRNVPGRLHSERFGVGAERATAPAARAPLPGDAAGSVRVTVRMDGRERQFAMHPDATVLEAAEAAGLRLPYSCRAGICSTCRAQVTDGEVTMARNQGLEDWEVAAGYVLCCQARPVSATLKISYDDV